MPSPVHFAAAIEARTPVEARGPAPQVPHPVHAAPRASFAVAVADAVQPVRVSAPAPVGAPAPVSQAATPTVDLEFLMLNVVADKTGYPTEMLGMDMQIEAELGIDSIKRVEILSALREAAPGMADINPAELGRLRTLGDIVRHMRATILPVQTVSAVAALPSRTTPAAMPSIDLENLLLGIVADKTGYPTEMLGMDMQIEAELGIDSIKRVEILSALREAAPGMADINPADLGRLRTLGDIVSHMRTQNADANLTLEPDLEAPAPAPAVAVTAEIAPAPAASQRFATRAVPMPASGQAMTGLSSGKLVITDDGTGIAPALARKLAQQGITATVVSTVPQDADGVIFLGGLRTFGTIDEALQINHEAFAAARSVAARFENGAGVFVTVQDTGGDFGLSGSAPERAWSGGLAGLVRTAAREWPSCALKTIDCERGTRTAEDIATAISGELTGGGQELEVGLSEQRVRITLARLPSYVLQDAATRIDRHSVLVVTGGARGVTAAALIALAEQHQPRLILIGRTELVGEPAGLHGIVDAVSLKRGLIAHLQQGGAKATPAQINAELARVLAVREIQATIDALTRAGSEVRYLALDVQDPLALRTALAEVRLSWSAITGIVHGAGVLADRRIVDKTDEQFFSVFNTKVIGLRALLDATAQDPLTAICLFSSIAAATGNVGQCDYAMANEVLNQVASAERARRNDCVVRSIGWGPWQGGMVTPTLAAHFEHEGVALLSIAEGSAAFVAELCAYSDDVQILVLPATAEQGALGTPPDHKNGAAVALTQNSHAYLNDHSIAGVPIVPVALALEWLVRAARIRRPQPEQMTLKHLRVLRKIALDEFAEGGTRHIHVRCNLSSESVHPSLALELCGDDGALHYRAFASSASWVSEPARAATPRGLVGPQRAEIYDGHVLFHGPRFQAIVALHGIAAQSASATLVGAAALDWPRESWQTDPALIDGGMQLAVLWAEPLLGGASLPMSVDEMRLHRSGLADGPVHCVVHARQLHAERASCDIIFYDADGEVRVELLKVELILRPGEGGRGVTQWAV